MQKNDHQITEELLLNLYDKEKTTNSENVIKLPDQETKTPVHDNLGLENLNFNLSEDLLPSKIPKITTSPDIHNPPSTPSKTPSRSKHRWGKEKDKELFHQIRTLEKSGHLTLTTLLSTPLTSLTQTPPHLKSICQKMNWKSSPKWLLNRIQKTMNPKFSVREQKQLKNLVRK